MARAWGGSAVFPGATPGPSRAAAPDRLSCRTMRDGHQRQSGPLFNKFPLNIRDVLFIIITSYFSQNHLFFHVESHQASQVLFIQGHIQGCTGLFDELGRVAPAVSFPEGVALSSQTRPLLFDGPALPVSFWGKLHPAGRR